MDLNRALVALLLLGVACASKPAAAQGDWSGLSASSSSSSSASSSSSMDEETPDEQADRTMNDIEERDAAIPSITAARMQKFPSLGDMMDQIQPLGNGSSGGGFQAMQNFMQKKLKLKAGPFKVEKEKKKGRCDYNEYQPWPCERFPCNDHGFLVDGACFCEEPWFGKTCEGKGCVQQCNGNGVCADGVCKCDKQYAGESCDKCSPGLVDFPNCTLPKFTDSTCPDDCGGPMHGLCLDGKCVCKEGWFGEACSKTEPGVCKNMCNGHGKCVLGVCDCNIDYYGSACEHAKCQSVADCSNNGLCREGKCICNAKFVGHMCSKKACRSNPGTQRECTSPTNGRCDRETGICICLKGYAGTDCSQASCPYNCTGHGLCNMGVCNCFTGFHGRACNLMHCPNNCSGHGMCLQGSGKCVCNDGFSGDDCADDGKLSVGDKIKAVDKCKSSCYKGCTNECVTEMDKLEDAKCGRDCVKTCDLDCTFKATPQAPSADEKPVKTAEPTVQNVDHNGEAMGTISGVKSRVMKSMK